MSVRVRPGLSVLLEERPELVDGCRVGLLAHAASVDLGLAHAADRLAARPAYVETKAENRDDRPA